MCVLVPPPRRQELQGSCLEPGGFSNAEQMFRSSGQTGSLAPFHGINTPLAQTKWKHWPTSSRCSRGHRARARAGCLVCSPGRESVSHGPRPFGGLSPRLPLACMAVTTEALRGCSSPKEMKPWQVLSPHSGSA